jgi:hypothetical protein
MKKNAIAKKSSEFIVSDDIFKTSVLFIFNCNAADFQARAKKCGVEWKCGEYVCGTVVPGGDGQFFRIVWVEKVSLKPEDIGTLAHEIAHLVVRICADKGVPICSNIQTGECGDETFAYLTEFYMIQCLSRVCKIRRKS